MATDLPAHEVSLATVPRSAVALLTLFLTTIQREHPIAPTTREAYLLDLTALVRWLGHRGLGIVGATRDDLLEFLADRQAAGAKPPTLARQLSSYRRFYRFLAGAGIVLVDPTLNVRGPKVLRAAVRPLTEAEVASLVGAPHLDDHSGCRDQAMLRLMTVTGLGVSALRRLRWQQVDLPNSQLQVPRKNGPDRPVPLDDDTVALLHRLRQQARAPESVDNGYCFPTHRGLPMTRQAFCHLVHKYALRAGLAGNISPKTLRQTAVSRPFRRPLTSAAPGAALRPAPPVRRSATAPLR